MMYCRGPNEKEVPLIIKVTAGKPSTAAHPAASRHVFVSAEYTIPGMACMYSCHVSTSPSQTAHQHYRFHPVFSAAAAAFAAGRVG